MVNPHSGNLFVSMIGYLTVIYLHTTSKLRTEAKFEGKTAVQKVNYLSLLAKYVRFSFVKSSSPGQAGNGIMCQYERRFTTLKQIIKTQVRNFVR